MTPLALLTPSAAPLRLRTPPGLLPDARHVVLPEGIAASGAPAIIGTCETLGIHLDRWQRDASTAILAKNLAGWYAADTVLLSIGRQVGKTFLVGAIVFADSIANPGTLTVWTAHRFKVARESFDELRALAEMESMAPHVDREKITTAAGNEVIPFRNGSRIVFAARERGSIRGFRKVRRLVLDEAQILTDAALSDLAPTQNQAINPQIILMGTPPKPSDPSEAFTRLRAEALSGQAGDLTYIEYSADPGSDPDDREAWRTANPSYPDRTPERALQRLRRLLDSDDFLREVMGIWTDEHARKLAIDPAAWANLHAPGPPRATPTFALDVAPDHSTATIAAAWTTADGAWLQLAAHGSGVEWVADRAAELLRTWGGRLLVEQTGTAAFLLPHLTADPVSRRFFADACSTLDAAVSSRSLRHGGHPELKDAVAVARWSSSGEAGQRVLSRKDPRISPLIAAALALHGLSSTPSTGGWMVSLP